MTHDRESEMLEGLQHALERLYQLEPAPRVGAFVHFSTSQAREQVLVKQDDEALELLVVLPERCLRALGSQSPLECLDAYLEAVEGISHFVHLAERARTRRPTTLLELELQAEVDKFALLTRDFVELRLSDLRGLHRRLYAEVSYLHPSESELGRRYRLANDLAARLWAQLLHDGEHESMRHTLRRFYRASQADKIRMVSAA